MDSSTDLHQLLSGVQMTISGNDGNVFLGFLAVGEPPSNYWDLPQTFRKSVLKANKQKTTVKYAVSTTTMRFFSRY
jgi:hypothetical protein